MLYLLTIFPHIHNSKWFPLLSQQPLNSSQLKCMTCSPPRRNTSCFQAWNTWVCGTWNTTPQYWLYRKFHWINISASWSPKWLIKKSTELSPTLVLCQISRLCGSSVLNGHIAFSKCDWQPVKYSSAFVAKLCYSLSLLQVTLELISKHQMQKPPKPWHQIWFISLEICSGTFWNFSCGNGVIQLYMFIKPSHF